MEDKLFGWCRGQAGGEACSVAPLELCDRRCLEPCQRQEHEKGVRNDTAKLYLFPRALRDVMILKAD